MISKADCLLLLTDISKTNKEAEKYKTLLYSKPEIDFEILKFIYKNTSIDVLEFYEKLRKNYNNKKSSLYINIMKEVDEPRKCITTLSSLLLQMLLYADKLDNTDAFLRNCRCKELIKVISNYLETYDLTKCVDLLTLYKTDIKALEEIKKASKND